MDMRLCSVALLTFTSSIIYGIPSTASPSSDLLDQAIARFPCPENLVAVFSPSQSCSSFSYTLVCKPTVSGIKLQATFTPGDCVTLIATPTEIFSFNIVTNIGWALHMVTRFDSPTVERNTRRGESWGSPETSLAYFPFTIGRQFNLTVCAEASKFKAWIDNTAMFEYNCRDPLSSMTGIEIIGDVQVQALVFN